MQTDASRQRLRDIPLLFREQGRRVTLSRWGVPFAALFTATVVTLRTHWFLIYPFAMPVMNDEGYITAMGMRLMRGHMLPYVDGVSQRGPLLYWLATLVMGVTRTFSWVPLRLLALSLALSTEALVFLLGVELFSPFAAGIAVLVQTYFFTYEVNASDAIGYNGEILGVQFVLLAALLIARAQGRPRPEPGSPAQSRSRARLLVAAGASGACAGLSKQMMLAHVGVIGLWLLLGSRPKASSGAAGSVTTDSPGTWRETARDVGWYALGLAAPYALVLGIYAAAGHLTEFVYYYQRYGRDIFMAPLTRDLMRDQLRVQLDKYLLGIAAVSLVFLFALGRAVRALLAANAPGDPWRNRLRQQSPALFLLANFVAAVVGASFTWRFFPHYFVQVYPFLGLLTAYAFSESLDVMDEDHVPALSAGVVFVAGAAILLFSANQLLLMGYARLREHGTAYQDPQEDPIVRYVEETTKPTDTIFVWGFRAEIHMSAGRYPASRYVYAAYPSGVVPWFHATRQDDERRVVPGSRELLIQDLEESKPAVIVDAGRTLNGRYMYQIPILRSYLDEHYCFARYSDGEPIYRRREGDACPPPAEIQ